MSSQDIAVGVEGLGKCYQIYSSPRDRLKQFFLPKLQPLFGILPRQYFRQFWALRDVSFELRRGETIGVMGKNGAGKSTLLQLICGTATPTQGQVRTDGRVAALLELGAGFNPDFSGRENARLSCQLLGLNADEAQNALARIEEFADVGSFIDQPVKHYSSGMYVRLAFAVSTAVAPDILIIDEALAVGDIRFQAKCFARLRRLQESGCAILLVSHSIEQIARHCDRAMLIDEGRLIALGAPKDVGNRYLDLLYGSASGLDRLSPAASSAPPSDYPEESVGLHGFDSATLDRFRDHPLYNPSEYRWGDQRASILDFRLCAIDGSTVAQLESGATADLLVKAVFHADIPFPVYGFFMKTIDGILVSGCNSRERPERAGIRHQPVVVGQVIVFRIRLHLPLAEGHYVLSVGVAEDVAGELVPLDRRYDSILLTVVSKGPALGLVDLGLTCDVLPFPIARSDHDRRPTA